MSQNGDARLSNPTIKLNYCTEKNRIVNDTVSLVFLVFQHRSFTCLKPKFSVVCKL